MANTYGNPTLVSDKARENAVLAYNTTLTSGPTVPNPLLRIRLTSTTLVDFILDATTPLTGATIDGSAGFNFTSSSAVAVGGTASVPNNYQVLGRDGAVHLSGVVNATDAITAGQTISALATALVAPPS